MNKLYFLLILLVLFGCKDNSSVKTVFQQTIYYNGDIVTMEGNKPQYAEAVVQEKGKIIYVGSKSKAFKQFKNTSNLYDLRGQTLMPGFIEPHAHPVSIGAFLLAHDIVAPHEWKMPHKTYPAVNGKDNYLKAVEKIVSAKKDKNKTVLIWGYHKAWHGILTLENLDKITGNVPTVIYQRSGHEIYLNTAAFKRYDIKENDVEAKNQADFKNNHFWELAYHQLKNGKLISLFNNTEDLQIGMERMSKMMLLNGITAMAEPGFPLTNFKDEYQLLKTATAENPYYSIYLISGFPEQFTLKKTADQYIKRIDSFQKFNTNNIKFLKNQFKTFADGAIYSLALQLRDDFHNCPSCHSEWIIPPKMGEKLFNFYWDNNYKIHIHITGDLGFEKYLDITENAMKRNPRKDHRTTFHHIGLFSSKQAERAASLKIEASANPYYLWALADKYSEIGLGKKRAENMVALNELTKRNIPVSLHSDFAMAPAEPLTLAWVAANRIVASGKTMNPEQRLSVFNAIKGITISAARTLNLENEIGSIKVNKEATFTLLNENPFKIDRKKIKNIKVIGVIYKGKEKLN